MFMFARESSLCGASQHRFDPLTLQIKHHQDLTGSPTLFYHRVSAVPHIPRGPVLIGAEPSDMTHHGRVRTPRSACPSGGS